MKPVIMHANKIVPRPIRSNLTERTLLVGFIVLTPLQSYFPTFGGASVTFLYMLMAIGYIVLRRPRALMKTLLHPICLAGFGLAGVGLLMEFLHGNPVFRTGAGIGLMVVGAAAVGVFCRDQKALRFALYGFMLASFIVGLVVILTAYGKLAAVEVQDFDEASFARSSVYKEKPLGSDINSLAFYASQGVIAALVLGLTTRSFFRRNLVLVVGVFLVVGTFLPMSRGAIVGLMFSCLAVVYLYGLVRPKVIIALGILLFGVLMLVPSAVLTRFDLTNTAGKERVTESRGMTYVAALDQFSDYFLIGVGETEFWGKWGRSSGFYNRDMHKVIGPHNLYVQANLFWGLPGLLALLAVVWQAYKFFPKIPKPEPLRLFLVGICVSVLMESLVVQIFQGKEFSIALGLIIGSSLWVWPPKRLLLEAKVEKSKAASKIKPNPGV